MRSYLPIIHTLNDSSTGMHFLFILLVTWSSYTASGTLVGIKTVKMLAINHLTFMDLYGDWQISELIIFFVFVFLVQLPLLT